MNTKCSRRFTSVLTSFEINIFHIYIQSYKTYSLKAAYPYDAFVFKRTDIRSVFNSTDRRRVTPLCFHGDYWERFCISSG